MAESQKNVWDKIATEWYRYKIDQAWHTIDFLKKQKGKILDLGGGAGRHLINIKDGEMYLVDFSPEMVRLAKKRAREKDIKAKFEVADISKKLPFEDNFFDAAISVAAIHCVKEDKHREKTIKELFRVLKPGATAEIAVWNKDTRRFKNSPKDRFIKWRDKGKRYYYLYSADEVYELFEKIGFEIIEKYEPKRNIIFIVKKPENFPIR